MNPFKINFNIGRQTLPSSKTENLIDIMRANRLDPIHNYTQNNSIKFMGDVQPTIQNQPVKGGTNIVNPAINEVRKIPFISDRRRTPVKTENRRKDVQATEALWDIRNNTSLNNATKVMPNYYQEKLKESARGKVRMTNTAETMRVQYQNPEEAFYLTGDTRKDSYIKPENYNFENYSIGSKDTGILRFSDLSVPNSTTMNNINNQTPSYNPFLPQSSQNKSDFSKTSYPDERMTRYSGERKYMTKGDRILRAADLAKSEMLKERRQLQAQAHDSLTGNRHAPRMYGADIANGINTTNSYNNSNMNFTDNNNINNINNMNFTNNMKKPTEIKIARVKETPEIKNETLNQFEFNSDKVLGNGLGDVIPIDHAESYVPRTNDLNRQSQIQQNISTYYGPAIEHITTKLNDQDIIRKIYAEQFGNNPIIQKSSNPINRFVDNIKSWLGLSETFERVNVNDDFRKKYGNIDAKNFETIITNISELIRDDSLSLQQRQAFNTDLRTQIKEYLENYNDSIKQDLVIQDILNNIAERCIINRNGIRKFDEDKFIEQILQNNDINNRLDELKIRTARNLMTEDKYMYLRNICEEYDIGLMSSWVDEKISELNEEFNLRQFKVKQYYTERGVKEEYSDDLKQYNTIMKPVSVLMNGNDEITRTILCKADEDKVMLLQRRDRMNESQYYLMKLEPEELINVLGMERKDLKLDPRIKDIYDLNFEEHVKLANYIDRVKNKDFIMVTKNAIHPYQRDLLDDDKVIKNVGVISNVMLGDDFNDSKNKRKNQNIIEHSQNIASFKGDGNNLKIHNQYCINENDSKNINLKNRKQNEMNPQEMYKTFGDML